MRTSLLLPAFVTLLSFPAFGAAFFDQFFQQQQQQQAPQRVSYSSQYESAPCDGYLCNTLDCVSKPSECPCPHSEQDVKCPLGKTGEYVCARDCNAVKAAMAL